MSLRLCCLLLCACTAWSASFVSVHGKVTDPTGARVPAALLTLTARDGRTEQATASNEQGEYRLSSVAPGDYLLSARANGLDIAAPLALHVSNDLEQDVELSPARIASVVRVTATSTAITSDEQGKALDVLDASDLESRAEFDVANAIRTVPGIRVQQLGGPGSLTRVNARGLRPFDTSILIDGFRLRDAASPQGEASAFIGDLMLVNSDRIEVQRGSGSSLYGTNAEGGVVSLITAPGGGRTRGELAVDGGGLGLARGVARLNGGALHDRLRYSGGVAHLNVTRGADGNDRYRNTTAQATVDLSLTPSIALNARVFGGGAFAQLNENPFVADAVVLPPTGIIPAVAGVNYTPSLDDPDSQRNSQYLSTSIGASGRLTPYAGWRVNYHHLRTDRDNRDGPGGVYFPPSANNSNFFGGVIDTVQARGDWQAGRHQLLSAGYEWERETFANHSRVFALTPATRSDVEVGIAQRSHTVFVQDQLRLFSDRLQILLSGRTQGFALDAPTFAGGPSPYAGARISQPPRAWTGDISLAYLIAGTGTKLRAHVGNGYRAPSLYERFGSSFYFGSFTAYGDPRLAPERFLSADFGFDQYLAGDRLRLSATYFYTRLQQVIAFDFSGIISPATDPFGRFGGYTSVPGGLSRGVESTIEARPWRSTTLRGTYTFTNAADRKTIYAGAGPLQSVNVSEHMGTATVLQRIGRRIDASFDLFAASDYLFPLFAGFSSRAYRFDGPVKADIAGSYTLPVSDRLSLKLFGRIENVFNRTYYEDGFRTPKAWGVVGAKILF